MRLWIQISFKITFLSKESCALRIDREVCRRVTTTPISSTATSTTRLSNSPKLWGFSREATKLNNLMWIRIASCAMSRMEKVRRFCAAFAWKITARTRTAISLLKVNTSWVFCLSFYKLDGRRIRNSISVKGLCSLWTCLSMCVLTQETLFWSKTSDLSKSWFRDNTSTSCLTIFHATFGKNCSWIPKKSP